MKKKGISPLIATVLLIGFTVALAAIIMTWGIDFIRSRTSDVDKQTQNSLKCVNELDFQLQVDCTNKKIAIDNRGNLDIIELRIRKHKKDSSDVIPEVDKNGVAAFGKVSVDGGDLSLYKKIDAIATIKGSDGSSLICSNTPREVAVNCP